MNLFLTIAVAVSLARTGSLGSSVTPLASSRLLWQLGRKVSLPNLLRVCAAYRADFSRFLSVMIKPSIRSLLVKSSCSRILSIRRR
jgi:hypothetical protein